MIAHHLVYLRFTPIIRRAAMAFLLTGDQIEWAAQTSDMGSIPIAGSINLDDSIAFMRLGR